jgi:hypothetical protein
VARNRFGIQVDLNASNNASAPIEEVAGAMDDLTESSGKAATAQTSFAKSAVAVGGALKDVTVDVANLGVAFARDLAGAVTGSITELGRFGRSITGNIPILKEYIGLNTDLGRTIRDVSDAFVFTGRAAAELKRSFSGLQAALGLLGGSFSALGTAAAGLVTALSGIPVILAATVASVGFAVTAFKELRKAQDAEAKATQDLIEQKKRFVAAQSGVNLALAEQRADLSDATNAWKEFRKEFLKTNLEMQDSADIQNAASDATKEFEESVRGLGVTLARDVNASIEANNRLLEESERRYRQNLIGRREFEDIERAVGEAIAAATASLNTENASVAASTPIILANTQARFEHAKAIGIETEQLQEKIAVENSALLGGGEGLIAGVSGARYTTQFFTPFEQLSASDQIKFFGTTNKAEAEALNRNQVA